jgi:deoxyribose-phosphate aldolase
LSEAGPQYEDLAGLIEYALVRTDLSEEDVARGCELAQSYRVASVVVRPCDVDLVARWLGASPVRLGTIVDIPHGYSSTAAKLYAARDLLRRGAREIDTVLNTGKLVSRQFQYLETELVQLADSCRESGALLAIHLESEYLTEELKIVACRIARRAGADYLATDRPEDIAFLKTHSRERLKIKSLGPVALLEAAWALRGAGCSRLQLTDPIPLLDAWKQQLTAATEQPPAASH